MRKMLFLDKRTQPQFVCVCFWRQVFEDNFCWCKVSEFELPKIISRIFSPQQLDTQVDVYALKYSALNKRPKSVRGQCEEAVLYIIHFKFSQCRYVERLATSVRKGVSTCACF